MLLANYDYKIRFRPGRSNGNADGLSQANQLPVDDATPSNFCCMSTPAHPDLPVTFDVLAAAVHLDPAAQAADVADTRTVLGPRQSLLEAAPCSSCKQRIAVSSSASIICDGCNGAFHLACVGLK